MKKILLSFVGVACALVSHAQLYLNELYVRPNPNHNRQEYFELYNAGVTIENADCYSLVTYFEDNNVEGLYVVDLPSLSAGAHTYIVGSSQAPTFNYQNGTGTANFSWNAGNIKRYVYQGGQLVLNNAGAPYKDIFIKSNGPANGNNGVYAVFLFKGSVLVDAFLGKSNSIIVPDYITRLGQLNHTSSGNACGQLSYNFATINNESDNKFGNVNSEAGTDNGYHRESNGPCPINNNWEKSSSPSEHTPGASNSGQEGGRVATGGTGGDDDDDNGGDGDDDDDNGGGDDDDDSNGGGHCSDDDCGDNNCNNHDNNCEGGNHCNDSDCDNDSDDSCEDPRCSDNNCTNNDHDCEGGSQCNDNECDGNSDDDDDSNGGGGDDDDDNGGHCSDDDCNDNNCNNNDDNCEGGSHCNDSDCDNDNDDDCDDEECDDNDCDNNDGECEGGDDCDDNDCDGNGDDDDDNGDDDDDDNGDGGNGGSGTPLTADVNCVDNVTVTYNLGGGSADAFPVTVKLYYDANGSQFLDDGDILIDQFVETSFSNTPTRTFTHAPGQEDFLFVLDGQGPCYDNIIPLNCPAAILLPVTFTSFTASKAGSSVSLKWTTSSETNNRGFNVQRMQGNGTWQTLGFVSSQAAGGNSQSALTYTYTDGNTFKGITQYRLQQVDIDGRSKYSDIRTIRNEEQVGKNSIYPNPSNGAANIMFANTNSSHDILVSDMNGRVVKQYRNVTDNTMKVDNLTPGVYMIRIVDRDGSQSNERLVVSGR